MISFISQSNAVLGIDDTLALQIYYVDMPVGAGRAKQALSIGDIRERSIVSIQNKDTLCLPRALVVARAHLGFKTNKCAAKRKEWRVICDGRPKLQKERAEKLVADAGVILPLQGCGFRELTVFQDFFAAEGEIFIVIVIFEKSNLGSDEPPFFDGRNSLHDINAPLHGVIYLIFEEQARNFNVITNLFAAAGSNFFCAYCNKGFRRIE